LTDEAEPSALSFRNPKVQQLRRLMGRRSARSERGQFAFEGSTLLAEAIAAGFPIDSVFVDVATTDRHADVLDTLPSTIDVHPLAEGVLAKVADTATPQGVIAVAPRPTRDLDSMLATHPRGLVIVLDRLGDPGNAGAIVRTAEAVGASLVVFGAGTTDPYGPKTVRAAAGSAFRVPLVSAGTTVDALDGLARAGFRRIGTVAQGGEPYGAADLTGDTALVLGSEAHGLDPEVVATLELRVSIPMLGQVESLNVAAAAAVLGYERLRQLDAAASAN
jgi:TrmH family RNA methyltransferase